MRRIWLAAAAAVIVTLVAGSCAVAQWEEYSFDIDLFEGYYYGNGTEEKPYEVDPEVPLDIWAHVGKEGHEGEMYHIEGISMCIWHVGGGATTWTYTQLAHVCEWHEFSEWFPWGVITLHGEPCNTVAMQADISIWSEEQGYAGPLYSNVLYLHIIPEPAAFTSLAGLVLGAASIGWFRFRKN